MNEKNGEKGQYRRSGPETPLQELVSDVCVSRGCVRQDIAEKIGVTPTRFSHICSGKHRADLAVLRKLAAELGQPLKKVVASYRRTVRVPEKGDAKTPLQKLVADACASRGCQRRDIASEIGVAPAYFTAVRSGQRHMSEELLRKLAGSLKRPYEEVVAAYAQTAPSKTRAKTPLQWLIAVVCATIGCRRGEIAQAAGLSPGAFSNVCAGRERTSRAVLHKLAAALNRPADEVLAAYRQTAQVTDREIPETSPQPPPETPLQKLVADACASRGCQRREIAEKVGVCYGHFCLVCLGRSRMRKKWLRKLAAELGQPLDLVLAAYSQTAHIAEEEIVGKPETALQKLVASACAVRGCTRQAIAAEIAVSPQYFSRLCAGKCRTRKPLLHKLAAAIQRPLAEIVAAYATTHHVHEEELADPAAAIPQRRVIVWFTKEEFAAVAAAAQLSGLEAHAWLWQQALRLAQRPARPGPRPLRRKASHVQDAATETPLRALVRQVCEERGLTQTGLLDRMSLRSMDRFSKVCAGVTVASRNFLEQLAAALERPLEEVVTAYQQSLTVPERKHMTPVWFAEEELAIVQGAAQVAGLEVYRWLRQQAVAVARRSQQTGRAAPQD